MEKLLPSTTVLISLATAFWAGIFANQKVSPIPAAPPAEVVPGPKTVTILAPNGKMNLIVKTVKEKSGTKETFFTQDIKTGREVEIYSEELSGSEILIPYNTFSPDNKYIFLKKTGPGGVGYFVVKTDGTNFSNDQKTADFLSLFNAKYPDHKVTDATGWGGVGLIVVNTDLAKGGQDHSFWYDVASNSFIQLASRFN